MIVGMGVDVVSLCGMRALLETEDSAFEARTFTPQERQYSRREGLGDPIEHLGARFAAKEAALKALDQAAAAAGITPPGVPVSCIEVMRGQRGRPALALHGAAAALAEAAGADRGLLTLSHDGDTAIAVVIFERLLPLSSATNATETNGA